METNDLRTRVRITDFHFFKTDCEDNTSYAAPTLDDSGWEAVKVPHDWAIGHDFAEDNDASYEKVTADGIVEGIRHTGRTGGLPIVGCGWYRTGLRVPEEARGSRLSLIFDGVMWESEIYLNGVLVGGNHYGYTSFCVDITDHVVYGAENCLAVRAVVRPACSRWYPGAGIYRNVYLVTTAPVAIDYCGIRTFVTDVTEEEAKLTVELFTVGDPEIFELELCGPEGGSVMAGRGPLTEDRGTYTAKIESPQLWSPDSPTLYTLRVRTVKNGRPTDIDQVTVGFRDCRFDPEKGFFLNGEHLKLRGVCNHHDLGVFGAALNVSALRRQLTLLKAMGVNSLRTTHNPPAPELLALCDRMGFLVIEEMFDEWKAPKVKNGYARFFDEHAEADVASVIHRDQNHPCVFLYSIGNEIPEQKLPGGVALAHRLAAVCRREDPTRLVTAGFDLDLRAEENGFFDAVDVIGLNYKPYHYKMFHEKYPEKLFYGSETASCVSTRGEYKLPAVIDSPMAKHEDLTLSDYGLSAPHWACYPDRELCEQEDDDFILGEYVWTGFDYLGEPTPYYTEWPARSSYFGILDTAGLPKSRYWLYKSRWSEEKVLAVAPHWNFDGHEGQPIDIHVFTNYDRVELFLNGSSHGVRQRAAQPQAMGDERIYTDLRDVNRCRIIFPAVPYAPGELVVVARGESGEELARTRVKTSGKPYAIRLTPEVKRIRADGEDACFIRASVVDRYGYPCPTAACELRFHVEGAGKLYATDNGDPRETVGYFSPVRKTLNGACVAVIQGVAGQEGTIDIYADGEGLVSAAATVRAKL